MSAAKGDDVILSSWFTGTVQVIDRKTGATREMMHGFKAPHDAIRLGDGSFLVNELGTKSRCVTSDGEVRPPLGVLRGPVTHRRRDNNAAQPTSRRRFPDRYRRSRPTGTEP